MIYARHAEASVTVCLMHWSSLDPLLLLSPRHPLPPALFFLLSFRGCLLPSRPLPCLPSTRDPTLSSSSTTVKAARSRGNRVHPRAHKLGATR